ncbi:MAG: DNA-binding protein [Candidatus Thermoplasmatota archaeon]|nr:DNA-binding protein [Candidatus Thermoplasmatota archaeon]
MRVLDTSAILSGRWQGGTVATVPGVIDEFEEGGHSYRMLQYAREAGLAVMLPPDEALERVRDAARRTGDLAALSGTDVEVLALAASRDDAVMVTDDYAMQNVARELDVRYEPVVQEGIREQFTWRYRCRSCGRWADAGSEQCPVCGGPIRRVRWK